MKPDIALSAVNALWGKGSRRGVSNKFPEVISYRVRTDSETQDRHSSFPFN
jgi:hypothetical protein